MANRFNFAWWNTSLTRSRPKKGGGNADQHDQRLIRAACVVRDLLATAHMVALGEVERSEFERLQAWMAGVGFEWMHHAERQLVLVFNRSVAEREDSLEIEMRVGPRKFTSAWKHSLLLRVGQTRLDVYVVHWPSDMSANADEYRRSLGQDLRRVLDSSPAPEGMTAWHQLVLGDFNEEPFDKGLDVGMRASRDRERVRKEPNGAYLYNPCWRLLGERGPWPLLEEGEMLPCGSYYNSGSGVSRWRSIDQVLVGRTLLSDTGWTLDESRLYYLPHECVYSAGRGTMIREFDHLPLVGELVHR